MSAPVLGRGLGATLFLQVLTSARFVTGVEFIADQRLIPIDSYLLSSLNLVLSVQGRESLAPIIWRPFEVKYSITVPSEAVAVAIQATVSADFQSDAHVKLHRPDDAQMETLASGVPSSFLAVPTEEAVRLILELRLGTSATNYTIAVLRSTITSFYEFKFPDPATMSTPKATLTGLTVYDNFGIPVRTKPIFFLPRRSQYVASVNFTTDWASVMASKNDPEASLELRIDGQDWMPIESGIRSELQTVPSFGWLLFEIKVTSRSAVMEGYSPLVYQAIVSKSIPCHERCLACFGPDPEHCLRCRAPLVLFDGRCQLTACPANCYYEWQSYQCRRCHPSCAQCTGPGPLACKLCPALHFLLVGEWTDPNGACVGTCLGGTFAHPPSRRCKLPPADIVKTFYVRLLFRVPYLQFQSDIHMQQSVINSTAFVLGLSLSDVRPYTVENVRGKMQMTIEVVSPFLPQAEADQISIDIWFGTFEVPVDVVTTHDWDELHPPLEPLPADPAIPPWAWGIMASASVTFLIMLPVNIFYFRRLNNTRKRYVNRIGVDPVFVNSVVDQSPAWLIRRYVAKDTGEVRRLNHRPDD